MVLTAPISWPIAYLLDLTTKKQDTWRQKEEKFLMTKVQLANYIEKHTSPSDGIHRVGLHAAQIMLAALALDTQRLCREAPSIDKSESFDDVEKSQKREAETAKIITEWHHVRCLDIDAVVDGKLCKDVCIWKLNRLPVISLPSNTDKDATAWCVRVYGFLHVKVCELCLWLI